jgi:hypothetical protein
MAIRTTRRSPPTDSTSPTSEASNLSPVDRDRTQDVFVRDLPADRTILVSRLNGPHGRKLRHRADDPSISGDGRFVAFEAVATPRRAQDLTAVAILAELGDARRFGSSRDAVRYAGLDITVRQSDRRRAPGHLSRQGPPALRWALYEAAQTARRQGSPDRDYYLQAAARLGGNRACLAVARKLLKRSYHTLRELGDEALQPA